MAAWSRRPTIRGLRAAPGKRRKEIAVGGYLLWHFSNDPDLASSSGGRDGQGKISIEGLSVGLLLPLTVSERSDAFLSWTLPKKGHFSLVSER